MQGKFDRYHDSSEQEQPMELPEDNFEVYNIDIPVNDDSPRNAETIFDDRLDGVEEQAEDS